MTIRDITADEWLMVRRRRAEQVTGYAVHSIPFAPGPEDKVHSYYIWPMGMQPTEALLRSLSAGCPLRAAEKFLAIYAPNSPRAGGYRDVFRLPEVCAAKATQNPHSPAVPGPSEQRQNTISQHELPILQPGAGRRRLVGASNSAFLPV